MQIMRHKGLCTVSYPCDFGWWQLLIDTQKMGRKQWRTSFCAL